MLIVKGVNFFPAQVEQALLELPGVHPERQIILEERDGVNDARILVEAEPGVSGFVVEKHLKERLGFSPKGTRCLRERSREAEGKAVRVVRKKI